MCTWLEFACAHAINHVIVIFQWVVWNKSKKFRICKSLWPNLLLFAEIRLHPNNWTQCSMWLNISYGIVIILLASSMYTRMRLDRIWTMQQCIHNGFLDLQMYDWRTILTENVVANYDYKMCSGLGLWASYAPADCWLYISLFSQISDGWQTLSQP